MREILFRGKRADNGEWVEGDLIHLPNGIAILANGYAYIDTETVGQYTGLTDKNGKKIFEGDIVIVFFKCKKTICTVNWTDIVAQFQLWQLDTLPKMPTVLNLGNYDEEVIGNIYDNPKLLEVE